MRITYNDGCGNAVPHYVVTIGPNEPFLMVKLGICFLQPVSSPGGCTADPVFKRASHNYIFHSDKNQLDEYSRHMDVSYPGWSERVASEDGLDIYGRNVSEPHDDDPSDRGIKLPAEIRGKAELDAMFEPYTEERKRGERAVKAHTEPSDVIREGKETA
jgi:hypothetical protein